MRNYFDEPVAASYDQDESGRFASSTVGQTVGVLAELAGGGSALELGIGTGRVALPLAAAGVRVTGIDLSEAMVARLRAKPGGDRIPVTIGDFATTAVGTGFTLAYLVFNTIMNLTTQDQQVDCFRNAAAHLAPGGRFVVEVGLPTIRLLPHGEQRRLRLWAAGQTSWAYDEYDLATQAVTGHYIEVEDGRGSYRTTPFRYVWPAELDLMARLAGMRLEHRWGDWDKRPFTSDSEQHVSVWRKLSEQEAAADGVR
jgi:SAM-dependent methyltransferase